MVKASAMTEQWEYELGKAGTMNPAITTRLIAKAMKEKIVSTWICPVCNTAHHPDAVCPDISHMREVGRVSIDKPAKHDPIENPKHYTSHPSGIECIQITEHMSFTLGNAIKYIWRADLKESGIQDLEKAIWYLKREIAKRQKKISTEKTSWV